MKKLASKIFISYKIRVSVGNMLMRALNPKSYRYVRYIDRGYFNRRFNTENK